MQRFQKLDRLLRFLVLLASILFACALSGHARETPKALIVAVPPQGWPPYVIVDKVHFRFAGIMLDVMEEIARVHGIPITYAVSPELRNSLLVKDGEVDAYPKAREWVDNPDQYLWTDPIIVSSDVLIYRKPRFPKPPESLIGLSIGIVHGFNYPTLQPLLDRKLIHSHKANTTKQLLMMIQRGRLDGAITNKTVAEWIMRNSPEIKADTFQYGKKPIASAPYRFAFNKNTCSQVFIKSFNRELATMKKDGRMATILLKYK
ncbi:substrate-binding periplasmic protein [Pseudodesulfovibrio piezophilus]|uniref:Solute-binding protein family 3/N-terminal domain-containing protein n=1 Tax=Pseudodesulfovibrio piezophilus (strain DSM 21447 / JCM 15486 / C1TLV30) TaxID=1322246 RepID=M1WYJ9_PSEP2|nr:transporter substrate-binding domain-containing protein [Pseudodesulfovibrio piezophilus]CCH50378.1 exported protein of unknown function [Pseudodesulfovibrio piezophilus C1TLV30]